MCTDPIRAESTCSRVWRHQGGGRAFAQTWNLGGCQNTQPPSKQHRGLKQAQAVVCLTTLSLCNGSGQEVASVQA